MKHKGIGVMFLLLILMGMAVARTTAKPGATTYFVDRNHSAANDSNPGTESAPWRTIQKAANAAVAGDTVYIKEGVYSERVTLANSGAAGGYITFKGYPGHSVVVDGTSNSGWHGLISIHGKDYIKVEGLEIRNNTVGWGVLVEHEEGNVNNAATHIALSDLDVHHTGGEAIQVRGNADDILIENCVARDALGSYSGIDIYQWDGGRPHHVTVTGCTAYNFPSFAGIASEQADNLLIENNVTYNSELGIDVGSGDNNMIRKNSVYSCTNGIALSSNEDSEIYDNVIYNIYDEALYNYYWSAHGEAHARNKWYRNLIYNAGFGIYESNRKGTSGAEGPTSDHEYFNNVFYNIGTHGSYRTPFWWRGVQNIKFYNNTVYMNAGYTAFELTASSQGAEFLNNAVSISGNVAVYNINDGSSAAARDYNCYWNRNGTVGAVGAHDVVGNPRFANAAVGDFHLQPNSPCIDAGTTLSGFGDDKDGRPRPQGARWDIGAYEFAPSLALSGAPANRAIHLTWTVNVTPPVTSTWRIDYYSRTVASTVSFTGITNTTRAYTLAGLTNYAWYTVTLNAMLGSTPFLTDTVRVMPTDRFVYLPIILR